MTHRLTIAALESVQTSFTKTLMNCTSAIFSKGDKAFSPGSGVREYMGSLYFPQKSMLIHWQ